MTAGQKARAAGFKSLVEVGQMVGYTPEQLRNYHKSRPRLFRAILLGCAVIKATESIGVIEVIE